MDREAEGVPAYAGRNPFSLLQTPLMMSQTDAKLDTDIPQRADVFLIVIHGHTKSRVCF